MDAVTIKASFRLSRQRKGTRPPTSAPDATQMPDTPTAPSPPPDAPTRPPCRAARMLALAHYVEREVESGAIASYSEAARSLGVTRARMTQLMSLLSLPVDLQEKILMGRLHATERSLRLRLRDLKQGPQDLKAHGHHLP